MMCSRTWLQWELAALYFGWMKDPLLTTYIIMSKACPVWQSEPWMGTVKPGGLPHSEPIYVRAVSQALYLK